MLFTWDEIYRTGIEEVDNQHIELFEMANSLVTANNKSNTISDAINFLCKYTINHFDEEEHFQEKYNYPKYDEHREMHLRFTKELTDMKNQIGHDPTDENLEELSKFVVDWLKEHILKVDKEMGIFILNSYEYNL